MKAIWKGKVIAESNDTIVVEGNHYFPSDSVNHEFLEKSEKKTTCPWKGVASYFNIVMGEDVNPDATWTYPEPKEAAKEIAGRYAFWRGVEVAE
jgi:uncharacterized protein (DUF427 family)